MKNLIKYFMIIAVCILSAKTFAQDTPSDSSSVNESKFFDSNGVKIFYTDEGSGVPVILIHGFSNSHREWVWSGVPAKLAKKYRVISIDVRGHGQSDKPHDPDAYGKELGEDVIRLLDYLEIPKAHIMGYSMGSMINGYLLTNHGDRFLTAIFGGGVGWHEITPEISEGNEQIVKGYEDPERQQQYLARNMDPIALAILGRTLLGIAWDKEKMAAVQVPVLAIRGSEDGGGVEGLQDFHEILPSAKLVEIEGATHAGPDGAMGRPEYIEAVLEFLAEYDEARETSVGSSSVNEGKFFDSNGVKIFYTDEGSGEPIVLIHGLSNSSQEWVWSGVPAKLAEKYRVISIDVRGHGQSDKPHDPNAYGKEVAEDVIRLLDYLKIPKAHIMGYSMGSMINAYLITIHEDRFLTAIFGGGVGWSDSTPGINQVHEGRAKSFEEAATGPQRFPGGNRDNIALAILTRSLAAIAWNEEKMAAVQVPVLAIKGSEDGGGIEGLKDFHEILPSVKLVEIEGATHAGPDGAMGRPEYIEAVQEFLAKHSQ